jgi:hypothetical protein
MHPSRGCRGSIATFGADSANRARRSSFPRRLIEPIKSWALKVEPAVYVMAFETFNAIAEQLPDSPTTFAIKVACLSRSAT